MTDVRPKPFRQETIDQVQGARDKADPIEPPQATTLNLTIYELNMKHLITKMKSVSSQNPDVDLMLFCCERLYLLLVSSGALNDLYMSFFIKKRGMESLHSFQDSILNNKSVEPLPRAKLNEMKYLLSLVVLHLYRHFKANDDYDSSENPFNLVQERLDDYAEFQKISTLFEQDLEKEDNLLFQEKNDMLPALMLSTVVHRNLLLKILRKLDLILDDEFARPSEAWKTDENFLNLIRMINEKKVSKNEFFVKDAAVQDVVQSIFRKLLRNFSVEEMNYEPKIAGEQN